MFLENRRNFDKYFVMFGYADDQQGQEAVTAEEGSGLEAQSLDDSPYSPGTIYFAFMIIH